MTELTRVYFRCCLAIAPSLTAIASLPQTLHAEDPSEQPASCHVITDDAPDDAKADPQPAIIHLTDFAEPPNLIPPPAIEASVDTTCDEVVSGDCDANPCDKSLYQFGDWLGYNPVQSTTTWLAAGDLEMLSLESFPTLGVGDDAALTFGTGFHFLSGPVAPDLPPRLFDLQMAFHARKSITAATTLDVKLGVGAFSDFETSARKGIRFPSHVVAHTIRTDQTAWVLGVDVLDRDDISVLPVLGPIWKPTDDLIFELVFPRPKVQLRLNDEQVMYFGGELGGGTWAIERADWSRDNATYRDLRITWGISHLGDETASTLEIGWAFDRELEYRSHRGDTNLDGAFVLRMQTLY